MGNPSNWYQQKLSTVHVAGMYQKPATMARTPSFVDCNPRNPPRHNSGGFTHRSPGCKETAAVRSSMGHGRSGPPTPATIMSSWATRSCWTVNDQIQRNTPQRRSCPVQSRQSTTAQGFWQQTRHDGRIRHTPSRQLHSQTTHRPVASVALRRAETFTDFAFASRVGQLQRVTNEAPTGTLPKVPGTSREGTTYNTHNIGFTKRASTLRSLASNPNLHLETRNGTTTICRKSDKRPRSLPAKFSDSSHSESTLYQHLSEPQKVLYVSRHGYHPRSKSPTYPILIGTKDTLNLALCKKLWRIRRGLEGIKARENSIVYSEISQTVVDENDTEQWYERMFGDQEEDDDQDMAAIERLRLANPNDEFAQSDETISTVSPRPQVELRFDRKYLKEHINDWSILGIDIEKEELKSERRLKTASVARPTSASRKVRIQPQTPIARSKNSHRQILVKRETKTVGRAMRESRTISLPDVASTGRVFHGKDGRKKRPKRSSKRPELASHHSEEDGPPDLENLDENMMTPSPVAENSAHHSEPDPNPTLEQEQTQGVELDDMERRRSLISKYLHKPPQTPPPEPDEAESNPVEDQDKTESPDQEPKVEKPKELTEKEKFVLMRKRMDERKAKMQKRREDFLDYSMIGIRSQRRRAAGGLGASSTNQNSLGSLMSTRLESMATFKTRRFQDVEIEDDDDEDDEEEEEDEAENTEDDENVTGNAEEDNEDDGG